MTRKLRPIQSIYPIAIVQDDYRYSKFTHTPPTKVYFYTLINNRRQTFGLPRLHFNGVGGLFGK